MEAIAFQPISVDVSAGNFLVRGEIEPRGDLVVYMNDENNSSFAILNAQFMPDGPEYKVPTIKQASITVNQEHIAFVGVINEEDVARIQFVQAARTAVFYTNWFAIRGNLHVHGETKEDELMEPTKNFYIVTDVSIFPIRQTTHEPQRKYPLVILNRTEIIGYHLYHKE
jgi:hypothetical protein